MPRDGRVPAWIMGIAIAEGFWLTCLVIVMLLQQLERVVPVPGLLDGLARLFAAPVAVGGWLFVWGDNGPPHPFMQTLAFNLLAGGTLYALAGLIIGAAVGACRSR